MQRIRSQELRFVVCRAYIPAYISPLSVGRFLLGILTDLYKWFSDEALYEQDNRTKTGGKIHYLPGLQQSWSPKFPVEKTSLLTWQNFRQVLRKWHRKLFKVGAVVVYCKVSQLD